MQAKEFLTAELAHAERQLTRVRRIAAQMRAQLETQGLSEVEVYEKLAANKAHRQSQKDEATFQQAWLRVHRALARLPQTAPPPTPVDAEIEALERETQHFAKPLPFRKPPTPGPNQPCLCGSNIKYKKCCGNPLRHQRPLSQPLAA